MQNMKLTYQLYGGPLDGLTVEANRIDEGREVVFDTAIESSSEDGVLTKNAHMKAIYVMWNGELTHKDLIK